MDKKDMVMKRLIVAVILVATCLFAQHRNSFLYITNDNAVWQRCYINYNAAKDAGVSTNNGNRYIEFYLKPISGNIDWQYLKVYFRVGPWEDFPVPGPLSLSSYYTPTNGKWGRVRIPITDISPTYYRWDMGLYTIYFRPDGGATGTGSFGIDEITITGGSQKNAFYVDSRTNINIELEGADPDNIYVKYRPLDGGLSNRGPYFVDDTGDDLNFGTRAEPFKTIQKAANTMVIGLPLCVSSTTYIFPGTYTQTAIIRSNKNTGRIVFANASNTKPFFQGRFRYKSAFNLMGNFGRVTLDGLKIIEYTNGINLNGLQTNMTVTRCEIVSNLYGIYCTNITYSNRITFNILSFTTNNAIRQYFMNHSIIYGNVFRINKGTAVQIGGDGYIGTNILIARNTWISNKLRSLYMSYGLRCILSNNFFGRVFPANGNDHVKMDFTRRLLVTGNTFYRGGNRGLGIDGGDQCHISKNTFISNNADSLTMTLSAYSNTVCSNFVNGNIYTAVHGIRIGSATGAAPSSKVFRNIVINAKGHGIMSSFSGSNIRIYNNVVYKCQSNGIMWRDTTSGSNVNNICISNGIIAGYGLRHIGILPIYAYKNILYGNSSGTTNTSAGNLNTDTWNVNIEPGLLSHIPNTASFMVPSVISIAINNGNGVGFDFYGTAPDIGFIETAYTTFGLKSMPSKRTNMIITTLTNTIMIKYTNSRRIWTPTVSVNVSKYPMYIPGSASQTTGWKLEYSTSSVPDQSYYSADYSATEPSGVKWIRWKRDIGPVNESGYHYFKVKKNR